MAIQMLHLPTDLTSASFSFDYSLVQLAGFTGAFELYLYQGHTFEEAIVMDVLFSSTWVYGTTEWISVSNSLNNTQVQNLQIIPEIISKMKSSD